MKKLLWSLGPLIFFLVSCAPSKYDLLDRFKPVCSGQSISNSSYYDANRSGSHPIVVILYEQDLGYINYTPYPSTTDSSTPRSFKQVELVACIQRTKIEKSTCSYLDGDRTVYTSTYTINLFGARTGVILGTNRFTSEGTCPMFLSMSNDYLLDGPLDWQQVDQWLLPFVEK